MEIKTLTVDITNEMVDWAANGYRLPTEAEWEKAVLGGRIGRFSWGDTITHSQVNYYSRTNETYDISATRGYHPSYQGGGFPYTSRVGSFAPNAYGHFDMTGNVYEWCWDWYGRHYYTPSSAANPLGPETGSDRVYRGGYWSTDAFESRIANRNSVNPSSGGFSLGFRPARGQ